MKRLVKATSRRDPGANVRPGSVRRRIGIAIGALLLLVVAVLVSVLDFRSDEEKIRDLVADFIGACRDRDAGKLWNLYSRASRKKAAEFARERRMSAEPPLLPDLFDELLFRRIVAAPAPTAPTLLAGPWHWPAAWLDDLRVADVEIGPTESILMADLKRHGEAQATLRFSRKRYGPFEPGDLRLILVREGGRWRVDHLFVCTFERLEEEWPPAGIRHETVSDGGGLLAIPVGFGSSGVGLSDLEAALAATTPTTEVRLDVQEDLDVGELAPWLRALADAGWPGFTLRSCRLTPRRRGNLFWVTPGDVDWVSDTGGEDRGTIWIETPLEVLDALLPLNVEGGPPPPRTEAEDPGEMTFRTIYPEVERLKKELAAAWGRVDSPTPILDPSSETSVFKLIAVWRAVHEQGDPSVLLALPGPGDLESRRLKSAK